MAGLGEALVARGLEVLDRGNLSGPFNPWQPPVDGYRHLADVVAWNRARSCTRSALNWPTDRLPILLGGDHCLGIGSISAVARHCRERGKKLRVLWLDAHADFNTSVITPSGNIHGMPVACLCRLGLPLAVKLEPARRASVLFRIAFTGISSGQGRNFTSEEKRSAT